MPPMRIDKKPSKKRNINVILTPNPNKVLKKLRSENCAVHVYVPGDSSENLNKLQSDIQPGSVTVITRSGLKKLKGFQSDLVKASKSSPEKQSSDRSSSSSSSSDSESEYESADNMSSG